MLVDLNALLAPRLIDTDPEFVTTITLGMQAASGPRRVDEIELLGDPLESFLDWKFDVKRAPVQACSRGKGSNFIRNAFAPKPRIVEDKCTQCGTCVKSCPVNPKAVDWHDGNKKVAPTYVYSRCIQCCCCQELCHEGAVELKVPLLRKLLRG